MAFRKYAYATVATPSISAVEWDRKAAPLRPKRTAAVKSNLVDQASEILGKTFNPDEYLLTHSTIVCSVDTFAPADAKLGKALENGFWVNRKVADYRITSETQKFINGNKDAWERKALLQSFKTFIGGQNFVEHVQQEELSKGRIIDAVARDIGSSVYIDILVATDRSHADLVRQIESGEMSTLSMGCNCVYTVCTKCGNCAADDTELCSHIQHQKGNTFYDDKGQKQVIAELCGHSSEPGGGVTFIEASWVAVPAFKGAVVRGILNPEEIDEAILKQAAKTLASPPKKWVGDNKRKKAGLWDADEGGEAAPADEVQPAAPEKAKSPLDETTEELTTYMLEEAKKKVKEMMNSEKAKAPAASTAPNDSLVRQASVLYGGAVSHLTKQATSTADFMDKLAGLHAEIGVRIPVSFYRAVLKVGAAPEGAETDEQSVKAYLQKVQDALKVRSLNREEAATVLRLSKMLKKATIRLNG